jgi:pyruvate/2-oxoglutarate dehydrogenase complex dihydrolipoamide acyltransferase (E2) component
METLATLVRWYKADGEVVRAGDVICEIETDMASQELTAWDTGILRRLKKVGDKVSVGMPVAKIDVLDQSGGRDVE